MGSPELAEALNGRLQLLGEGHFPDQMVVLCQRGHPGHRLQLLEGLLLELRSGFLGLLLEVVLEQTMLEYKLFDVVSLVKPAIVLLDELELDPPLFLTVVVPELQVGQQHFCVLVVLHFKLASLFVEALQKVSLLVVGILMSPVKAIIFLVGLVLVSCGEGDDGGRVEHGTGLAA